MISVVTPASNFRLTTVANLKADLGIAGTDQDTALGRVIDAASAAIARYCNRVFAAEVVREIIDPRRCSQAILLERYPVIAVSAMTLAGVTVDPDDIEVDAEAGFIWRLDVDSPTTRIPWEAGRAVVTYRAGYLLPGDERATGDTAPDLPADLERACLTLATRGWHNAGRDMTVRGLQYSDGSRIDYGLGATSNGNGMPADVAMLIDGYRRPVL